MNRMKLEAIKLKQLLESVHACYEAVVWVGDRDLKAAWAECDRGDWMLWLCGKMEGQKGWPTRKEIVLAACDCAEISLPIFEKKYPKDVHPRAAIETARKWANGEASISDVRSAAYAAHAAAAAAYAADAAAHAAAAAAYAAYAAHAAAAAYAAHAAAYAAHAAANVANVANVAYARTARLRECADICRKRLVIPVEKRGER